MDLKHFINLITSESFWTDNRKRIVLSAFAPLIIGALTNKSAILMLAYMYIAFPILLFSKYASPLIYLNKGMFQIAHRTYSKKEFLKIIATMQNIFVLSIGLSMLVALIGWKLARLDVWWPYLTLHLYCWWKNEPLSIIREWMKRIKFGPLHKKTLFEDSYHSCIGTGPKATHCREFHKL